MQLSRVVCWPKSVATLNACKMHIERAHVCIAYVSRSVKAQQCLIPWPTWTTESQIVVDISRRISGPGSAHLRLHFQKACTTKRHNVASSHFAYNRDKSLLVFRGMSPVRIPLRDLQLNILHDGRVGRNCFSLPFVGHRAPRAQVESQNVARDFTGEVREIGRMIFAGG